MNKEDYFYFDGDFNDQVQKISLDVTIENDCVSKVSYQSTLSDDELQIFEELKKGKQIISFKAVNPILESIRIYPSDRRNEVTLNGVKLN